MVIFHSYVSSPEGSAEYDWVQEKTSWEFMKSAFGK